MDGVHGARTNPAQWQPSDDHHGPAGSSSSHQAPPPSNSAYSQANLGAGGGVSQNRLRGQWNQQTAMRNLQTLHQANQQHQLALEQTIHLLDQLPTDGSPLSAEQFQTLNDLMGQANALSHHCTNLRAQVPEGAFSPEQVQELMGLVDHCNNLTQEANQKLSALQARGSVPTPQQQHGQYQQPTMPQPGSNNPFATHNAPPPQPGSNNPFATHAQPNYFGQPGVHQASPLNAHPLYSSIASMPQGMVPPHMQHGMQAGMEKSLGHYLLQQHVSDFMQMLEFLKQIHEKANKLLEIR